MFGDLAAWLGELLLVPAVLIALFYCVPMAVTNGQSLGKRLLAVRVVREDGRATNFASAFVRQVVVIWGLFLVGGFFLMMVPAILTFLWPLWDENGQALHDKVAKTRVVVVPAAPDAPFSARESPGAVDGL